jgi:opacity protein-like surface antigen
MKKFLVAVLAIFCVSAASAQENNVGIRFDRGINIVGQYELGSNNIEGRIGFNHNLVNLTGLYNWEIAQFDWTPGLGKWFFDAGVGANVTAGGIFNLAVVGSAQFGIKFNNAPISITIDAQPALNLTHVVDLGFGGGISIAYHF